MEYNEDDFDAKVLEDNIRKYEEAERNGTTVYMEPDELTDIAEYYYNQGNIQKAVKTINYAIGIFPHSNMPLIFRARIAMLDENNMGLAKELAKQVGDKADLEYFYLMAEMMLVEKRPDDADKYLQGCMGHLLNEDDTDYALDVATLFADYREYDIAERWLSLCKDKELADYKELEGLIASGHGNYTKGEHIFERLLDEDPFSNRLWNNLASVQMMQNRIDDAIASSEYSIAINPNDDEAIINKANGLFNLAQFEEALKYYKRYTKLRPNDYYGYMYQGNTLLNMNCPKEAIMLYEKAEQLIGDDSEDIVDLHQELAFALSAVGRIDEALQYADRVEHLPNADKVEAWILKGHILLEHKRNREAMDYFQHAVLETKFEHKTLFLVAISMYDCNYYDPASKLLKTIVDSKHNTRKEGFAYLAACYHYLDKEKEFRKYLKKACTLNPVETKLVFSSLLPDDVEAKDFYQHIINQQ